MPDIQWYPGHMAKTRRLLATQLKMVDAVIELCDARAPLSTRNPDLERMSAGKARVLLLNKSDLASERETDRWIARFRAQGLTATRFNANGGKARDGLRLIEQATKEKVERMKLRGVNKTVRVMVVGIPNVGKSTFINRLCGAAIAKTADRPGVTRANQWVKVEPYLELLDTPGMLWPKLENQSNARTLAFLGSIRDEIMDSEALAGKLLERLMVLSPEETRVRFRMTDETDTTGHALLEAVCRGRGFLLSGGRIDTERGAAQVLDEFRAGRIGRITLETVDDFVE